MDTKFNINKGNNVGTDSVTGGNNMKKKLLVLTTVLVLVVRSGKAVKM